MQIAWTAQSLKRFETQRFNYILPKGEDLQWLTRLKNYSEHSGMNGVYNFAFCGAQGNRESMEDCHISENLFVEIQEKKHIISLFGIFDGHSGTGAAIYLRDNLVNHLKKHLEENCSEGFNDVSIWNSLKKLFPFTSKEFLNESQKDRSGSTAIIAMILENDLWVANVGDSTAFLDDGTALSDPAKPDEDEYRNGIEKDGGYVCHQGRLNGTLATARAIGDRWYVGRGLISKPKITRTKLDQIPENSHLILGCDGITDVGLEKWYAEGISQHKIKEDITSLARGIVYSALQSGSMDNVSAIVVKLKT